MTRGVIAFFSPQIRTITVSVLATSISTVYPNKPRNGVVPFFFRRPSSRYFCKCSQCKYSQLPLEYTDVLSRRMQMAALKPHHRIAMGVSGGADSMALCALMTHWKTFANAGGFDNSEFVDGLLAIIVDHGLRSESKQEAETVSRWVSDMGIRCEVVHCHWPDGRPKVGHLEEVARDMRYKIFQDVCFHHQIGVLLTAHHGDDQHGYAVIDLESLKASEREDICLSRFLALVLQFVSQRHRPVRGSASRLLLDYVRTFPCETSLTAAGCYLCAAPGTKGTKLLVCCSVQSALPAKTELYSSYPGQGQKQCFSSGVEQIIIDQKCMMKHFVPDASHVHFLDAVSSKSVLVEARRLEILGESTYESILELQMKERQLFNKSKSEVISSSESRNEVGLAPTKEPFRPGQSCYFMSRFFLTWMSSDQTDSCYAAQTLHQKCSLCMAGDVAAYIRHMIDVDWLFLAKLSKAQDSCNFERQKFLISNGMEHVTDKISLYSNYARSSAQQALRNLKSIPVAARRGLPVVVSTEGFLLSVPGIGFNHCPSLMISGQFKPRVPLGGGHSSFW